MSNFIDGEAGTRMLLTGNEAIARGALEAGIKVAAAYPGTPATEINENLSKAAKAHNLYVEWSANEKVAMEVAAGDADPLARSMRRELGALLHRFLGYHLPGYRLPAALDLLRVGKDSSG